MGSLDFGKLTTIALVFFIVTFFFGGEIMHWMEHKDDVPFEVKNMVYTKKHFQSLEAQEQKTILAEISSLCLKKHHKDTMTCTDTSYWFANNLEDEGVDADLAIEWMKTCSEACQTGKYVPDVYEKRNKVTGAKMKKSSEKAEGTKWFWER